MSTLSRKVFILGSGFSAAMGLPTLLGLFQEIMARDDRPGDFDKENVLFALEVLYPHFNKSESPPAYPPFEQFLSLVHSARDLPFFPKGYWETRWRSTLRLLTDCLADKSRAAERFPLLLDFVSRLRGGDVLITFNWDNLPERCLFLQSRRVSFLERCPDSIAVLKLHGSLNWGQIPEGQKLKHPESVAHLAEKIVCTHDYAYYDLWDVLDSSPLIVPPIFGKKVPSGEFQERIWHEAFNHIVDASQVSVIGYSMPNDDLQARALLRTAWAARKQKRTADSQPLDRYILIDPDPRVCGKYSEYLAGEQDYHQSYLAHALLQVLFREQ